MGIFDFLSGLFGPRTAEYYFSCPKCKSECKSTAERCENCGFRIRKIMTRKCPKCGALNYLDAGRCVKCGYSLANDKNIKFVYSCPTCGNESENYNQVCTVCGNQIA
jgi:ribosomal protein L40E